MPEEYYKTKASVEEYIKAAEGFSGAKLIDRLKVHLVENSSILEIGSGPGTDWEILSENYNVTGSDNSPEFISYLTKNHPQGKFIQLDAVTLEIKESFDGVYSNKVLHHLTDEELQLSISRQTQILNPKGVICHSFWKGEGDEDFKGMFVNYHTEAELKDYFQGDFDILVLESYGEFENDDSLFIIAQKK